MYSRRTPGNLKLRKALHQRGQPFLQLRPRKDFAETSMHASPKYQVSARMIGSSDIECVRLGIKCWISQSR